MKNIDISTIEKFNRALDNGETSNEKTTIEKFIKATLIHLEEDIKRVKKSTLVKAQYLDDLYKKAVQTEERILRKQRLNIEDFREFNVYNTAKTREIRWIAIATVILIVIAVIFHVKLG